jgi:hypothetical protein
MKKILFFLSMAILSFSAAWAQTPGNTMYITVKKADVKTSTGFFAASRGTLELGAGVTVIQIKGKWAEIRSTNPPLSGWVAATALGSQRPRLAGSRLGAGEIAMAGKGFSGEVEQIYRQGEELDYSPVDAMESFSIPDEELRKFLTEGRLAAGE